MFKKIILFFCVITSSFALEKPELDDEVFFDFSVNPPRLLKPYDFIVFSNDEEEFKPEKSDKKPVKEVKIEEIKPAFCQNFYLQDNQELNEKHMKNLDDARYFLKAGDKLFVDVYYKKDTEFNQREFRRNSVKKSFAVQNYLVGKNVDKAQISFNNIETSDMNKVGKIVLRINSDCQ